jgi:hypothetical protein
VVLSSSYSDKTEWCIIFVDDKAEQGLNGKVGISSGVNNHSTEDWWSGSSGTVPE